MSNNSNYALYSGYPVDAHITIHYQNVEDNNTRINDTTDEDDKNNESEPSISSLTSSPSTPTMHPMSVSPSLHIIETVLNISNQNTNNSNYNHNHDHNHNHNHDYIPKTKIYPNLTDLGQCRNMADTIQFKSNFTDATAGIGTHNFMATPLVRRFTEPIYMDKNMIDSLTKSDTNGANDQSYPPDIPCTRHHHRRNTIAIKFNKPLYKQCLTNK